MIEPKRGDASDSGLGDNVGAIEHSPYADFENGCINPEFREDMERHQGQKPEIAWHWRGRRNLVLDGEWAHEMERRKVQRTVLFSTSLSHTWKKYFVKSPSEMGAPLILIRSRTATK